jgi:hypothetical protein
MAQAPKHPASEHHHHAAVHHHAAAHHHHHTMSGSTKRRRSTQLRRSNIVNSPTNIPRLPTVILKSDVRATGFIEIPPKLLADVHQVTAVSMLG